MTETSEYEKEVENNNKLAMERSTQLLEQFMEEYHAQMEELIDFMYNSNLIKKHGWGTISVHIQDGKIVKWEAMMRTLRYAEKETKLK